MGLEMSYAATIGNRILTLPIRAIRSLGRRGVVNTAWRAWLTVHGAYREWQLGIRTQGSIDGCQLGAGPDSFGYQPIPYSSFDAAMRRVPIAAGQDVFVDYGCGMGRAIVLAARLPFQRVIGVEHSAPLCDVARDNVSRARGKLQCPDIRVVNADAQTYTVPDDASVLFLFNPFGEPIVRSVLQRIRESLERRPWELRIVYALPNTRRDLLAEQSWLTLQDDLETVHADWQRLAIYSTDVHRQSPAREFLSQSQPVDLISNGCDACQQPELNRSGELQIQLRRCDQLTDTEWSAWADFQERDPALESPYFRPEFTRAVAAARDVEVAVLESAGEAVGFFPFQRIGRNVAQPVGGRISDYQGVIGRPGLTWDAEKMLRECDLAAWHFDHVLCSQRPFCDYHHATDRSPYLDLSNGFEVYRESLRKSGADELKQALRKARKLEREVGPLSFLADVKEPELFSLLVEWKSRQYRRTHVSDVFAASWTVQVLETILRHSGPVFAGVLSVLYAADRPVAMHLGMRSRGVLHWWFPAYDPQFRTYSPGRILLAELARAAESLGIEKIDLGRGVASYKARSMSGSVQVAEGSVDLRPVARVLRQRWRRARDWVRSSPLAGPARVPRRVFRQLCDWAC